MQFTQQSPEPPTNISLILAGIINAQGQHSSISELTQGYTTLEKNANFTKYLR